MDRRLIAALGLMFAGALFLVGFVLYSIAQRIGAPPEAPIHYTQGEYPPEHPIYAPGETMIYSPTLVIKTPGRVDVFRSFWSRTKDANAVLCSGQPAPTFSVSRNFPPTTIGNVRGGSRVLLLIPNLPPGDYWLLSTASGPGGGQSQYSVPFKIIKPC